MVKIPLYIRWIFRRWAVPCVQITTAMLLLFSFFDLLNQWDSSTQLPFLSMLMWIARRLPFNFYEMLPFAAMLSAMITARNWVQYGEWTIVRFAGWKLRHSLIALVCAGTLLGSLGLFADMMNARWMDGLSVTSRAAWIHSSSYIFKIKEIKVTSSHSAELFSVYVYPDSSSVQRGTQPAVVFMPHVRLANDRIIIDQKAFPQLPETLPLPFFLVLEPNTLERLDLPFLASTIYNLKRSNVPFTPAEHILHFTFAKKTFYPIWIIYWIAWGSLMLFIPPRFRHGRFYQAGLFTAGALLLFCYRTLSTVLMQQNMSGWLMNGGMLIAGLLGFFAMYRLIRWHTSGA